MDPTFLFKALGSAGLAGLVAYLFIGGFIVPGFFYRAEKQRGDLNDEVIRQLPAQLQAIIDLLEHAKKTKREAVDTLDEIKQKTDGGGR